MLEARALLEARADPNNPGQATGKMVKWLSGLESLFSWVSLGKVAWKTGFQL